MGKLLSRIFEAGFSRPDFRSRAVALPEITSSALDRGQLHCPRYVRPQAYAPNGLHCGPLVTAAADALCTSGLTRRFVKRNRSEDPNRCYPGQVRRSATPYGPYGCERNVLLQCNWNRSDSGVLRLLTPSSLELNSVAVALTRSAFGEATHVRGLSLIREGPRSRVYRVTFEAGPGEERTAVLKQITDAGECGFTDWASLQFLTGRDLAPEVVPGFLAGEVDGRSFLLTDLGPSRTLEDCLRGNDAGAVVDVLRGLARAYARLHSATREGADGFLEMRRTLPAGESHGREAEAARWLRGWSKLETWAVALGVPLPKGFRADLEQLAAAYADPGPFLAFTHGDPAPTNNHVSPAGVRLLDFEYGGFRHALYDLTAWNVLCPLPESLVREMVRVYRAALPPGWRVAGEDREFTRGWAMMSTYRALAMLTWIDPVVLDRNFSWVGEWTAREALVAAVERLVVAASELPDLAGIASFAERTLQTLRERWPEYREPFPPWPALAS